MSPEAMRSAWQHRWLFLRRGMVDAALVRRVEEEVIAAIRADPPERHPDEIAYLSGTDYYIYPEKRPSATAVNAEDRIAKVFNCHVFGVTRAIAQRPRYRRHRSRSCSASRTSTASRASSSSRTPASSANRGIRTPTTSGSIGSRRSACGSR